MEAGKMGGGSCASSPGGGVAPVRHGSWGGLEEANAAYDSSQNLMTVMMKRKGRQEL
jgi:hypothetical protein